MEVGVDPGDPTVMPRIFQYKNRGQSVTEGRKKREEEGLQLRKSKRDEQVMN